MSKNNESVMNWTDSKISDEMILEIRANHQLKTEVIENLIAGVTVKFESGQFSGNLRTIMTIEADRNNKSRIMQCLEKAIEEIFSEFHSYDMWLDLVKENKVKITLDGVTYHDVYYNENSSKYSIINEDNYVEALRFFVKDIAIEKRKLVSIIDILEYLDEQMGKVTKNVPIGKKIMIDIIADVMGEREMRKTVRKLCLMHGRSGKRIEFDPSQIDEMGYYVKGKYYLKRVKFNGKLSSLIMIWNDVITGKKMKDFTPKMYQTDFDGNLLFLVVEDICNCRKNTKGEVLQKCKDIADIVDYEKIEHDIKYQLLNNTYFDLDEGKPIKEIDPEKHFVTLHMPITYDPLAKCPNLHQYIKNAVCIDDDPYKTKISILHVWETITWIVCNHLKLERGVFYVGQAAKNGKSIMLKWQEGLINNRNVSTVPLEDIGNDRFATADIFGKKLNQNADIDGALITKTGTFKKLMTRDRIRGQHKGVPAFDFTPYAVHVWSVNDPPEFKEKNGSIWRRLLPIEFKNKFEDNPTEEQLKKGIKKIDRNLVKNIFKEQEYSGAFNVCMSMVKKLRKQGERYSYEPSEDEIRDYWEGVSNHLLGFSKDMFEKVEDAFVIGEEMDQTYANWCEERRRQPMKKGDFVREFPKSCVFHTTYRKESNRISGKYVWDDIWFLHKNFPLDDKGRPIFTCQQCKVGQHTSCRHDTMMKGDNQLRCKCANGRHQDATKQSSLYRDSADKPIMACVNCGVKKHDDCLDERNCLCANKKHPKEL